MTFLVQSHRDTKLVATGKEGRNHRGLSTLVTFCALPILHTGGCRHRLWAPQSSVLWNADLIGSSWALASWQVATEFSALFLHVIALLSSRLLLTCSYCILNIKHALICWQAWIHRLAPTGGFAWPTSQHFCRSPQLRISPSSSFCCSDLFHDPEFLNHQLLHFTCIVFCLMSQPVRKFIVPLLPAQRQLAREPPQAPCFQHLSSEAQLTCQINNSVTAQLLMSSVFQTLTDLFHLIGYL